VIPENHTIQRGRGKGRDQWAIRKFLSELNLTMTAVAAKANAPLPVVTDTVRGVRNHGRVLAVLEALGCPMELLYPNEHQNNERRIA
jgi:hypothetical protein